MSNCFFSYKILLRKFLILTLLLFSNVALAETTDLSEIMYNLRQIIYPFITLILVISYVAGIFMIFKALGMLKKFGMPMSHMAMHGELAGPLVYLVVGSILLFLPSATNISLVTVFGGANVNVEPLRGGTIDFQGLGTGKDLLSYIENDELDDYADLVDTLVLYMQFIGFIAFVRGWFIIAKAGNSGSQPGAVSKGIVHIVAGVISINFVQSVAIIKLSVFGEV